ncbi:carbohydrate kinase family protein [Micromonospora sp. NPDC048947]|uniref:carbohydrate kinase family protein n=1 Tax=Micromonospora sp. NPDC048947 TaxID=3154826 RepID=UPI0033F60F88
MRFPGRFSDQFLADRLHAVSLSFLVDELVIRRGGVAANIAYGMSRLGLRPSLVGAVGRDFADYRSFLERHGVDCSPVLLVDGEHTARFICTTDEQQCQIASFYPGAMAEAHRLDLAAVVGADRAAPDLVIISPDSPAAMLRHAACCRQAGWPFAADPSQQIAGMPGEQLRAFITGARYLLTNEYEFDLLLEKCELTEKGLLGLVGTVVTTLGPRGVRIRDENGDATVPAASVPVVVDPTGGGDAFRAGFFAGIDWGLSHIDAAAIGCQLAWYALQHEGGQQYDVTVEQLCAELAKHYRIDLADAVRAAVGRTDAS